MHFNMQKKDNEIFIMNLYKINIAIEERKKEKEL